MIILIVISGIAILVLGYLLFAAKQQQRVRRKRHWRSNSRPGKPAGRFCRKKYNLLEARQEVPAEYAG